MDCSKQKRHAVLLYRSAMAFLVFFFARPLAYSQLSHSFGQIPVGNSDTNGFVRVDKVFYSLSLGNGRNAELFLKFSSDPRQEPKYLGVYWAIPFFDSNIIKLSTNRYRWVAPNLRTYTFNKEQKADRGYKETYILNTTGKLKLNVAKDGSICIENVDDLKNRYLFKNGRLVSFCEGKDADTFKISYETGSRPSSVYNVGKNSTEIKFAYNKDGFLAKIVFPNDKKALFITYSECDTFAEDGITKQGKLLKSISSITFADGKKEEYRYSAEAKKKNRNILTKKEEGEMSANVPINKFEQKIGEDNKGFIEWDATTGIIVSDSGGEYAVRNPIFDKYSSEYTDGVFVADRKREMKTKESRISYKNPENKYAEVWDYSLRTAVKIEQNPHTGEQTRTSYIGTPGNASMKIRKIEKKLAGENNWKISLTKAYDNKGNLIREIDGQENVVSIINKEAKTEYFTNGILSKVIEKNENNQSLKELYADGRIRYMAVNDGSIMKESHYVNGILTKYTEYDLKTKKYTTTRIGNSYDIWDRTENGTMRRIKLTNSKKEICIFYNKSGTIVTSNSFNLGRKEKQ